MWIIKTDSETCKTFKVDRVFEFIINSDTKVFEFSFNYLPITKYEFLKLFLNTSGEFNKYIQLETKLISEKSIELWQKSINH